MLEQATSAGIMKRCSVYSIAAVAAAVAVFAVEAAAVSAPHGAYIGCFDISDSTKLVTKGQKMADISGCAPACQKQQATFAMIGTDSVCRCSGVVPDVALQLDGKECLPGSKGVAVFYLYTGAANTLCRISNVAMSDIKPAYAASHVTISADGTMRVELKSGVGSRLETTDSYLYGLYQIEAKVSGASGVISSFYTRSSRVYPNTKLKDFSEIDWEFCNGRPCSPNMMHANSFTKAQTNQEVKIPVSDYQSKLGSGILTNSTFITYGINWQSNFLAWYANGQLMHVLRNGDWLQLPEWEGSIRKQFQSPDLAQHQVISMWTDDRDVAPDATFGGNLDTSKAPFYSYFRQLRRVVCDRPMLTDPAAAAAAMGPSWLYGKSNAVSDDLLETAPDQPVIKVNVSDTTDDADDTNATAPADSDLPEVFVPITVDPTTLNQDDKTSDSPVVIGPGWLPDLTVYPMNDLQLLYSSGLVSSNTSLGDVSLGPNAAGAFTAGMCHMIMAVLAAVVLSAMMFA